MTMNGPEAGGDAPLADTPPPDAAVETPVGSRPLPAGPVARRALRWQPWSAEPAITALSAVSGEPVRVVAPERPRGAGDRIAILVAEADWPALRSELGAGIPGAVLDDLRQSRERLGAARYVHALINGEDPTYEVGGDNGVATLRLYRLSEAFIDIELLSPPSSVSGDMSIE